MRQTQTSGRKTAAVILFDVLVVVGFWYCIPLFKRPFEGLMLVLVGLGVLTALLVRNETVRVVAMLAIATAGAIFGIEMAQKYFNVVSIFEREAELPRGIPSPLSFDGMNSASYFAARERALAGGADPEIFREDFAGNIFADIPEKELRVKQSRRGDRVQTTVSKGVTQYVSDSPLGVELRPNFRYRDYAIGENSGRMLWDGEVNVNRFGTRVTRGREDADDVYVFMGCSFTLGMYLSDHQAPSHYFSEAFGFEKRVVNTAIGGNGPHHSLRDLELFLRLGRSGVKPSQVRAVYYGIAEDHVIRPRSVFPPGSPRYELVDGRPVYQGTFADIGDLGRFGIMMARSRVYPLLRNKFGARRDDADFELMYAILGEMHRICQEKFGIPLTVVNWAPKVNSTEVMRDMGIRVIPVTDIFGEDWEERAVFFLIPDGHPSPYANKCIGRYLHALEMQEKRE